MNRKEFVDLLTHIENSTLVYQWKYGDIDIWPIIKKNIFFNWINTVNSIYFQKATNHQISPLSARVLLLKDLFYKYRVLTKLNEKDIFFSGAKAHRVDYEQKFINRYFEPLKVKDNFSFAEYGSVDKKKTYPENILEIERYVKLHVFKKKYFNNRVKLLTPDLSEINDLLKRNKLTNLVLNELKISELSNQVLIYSEAYSEILNKVKPKSIFGLCYYSPAMFGMFNAANKLGIQNYDIQHGGQGSLHPMYTFSFFPIGGLNTLPEYFWLWDESSLNNIQSWLPKSGYHKAEVKGNPWIDFVVSNQKYQIVTKEKIILYTLQYPFLDDYILEAIQKTPNEYKWWLRLHPRMKDKEYILKQLNNRALLNKIEIEKATDLPLPALLSTCSIHISKYSGSIIEAELLNKHSIILESVGCNTFKDIIEKGNATGIKNPTSEEIIKTIKVYEKNN